MIYTDFQETIYRIVSNDLSRKWRIPSVFIITLYFLVLSKTHVSLPIYRWRHSICSFFFHVSKSFVNLYSVMVKHFCPYFQRVVLILNYIFFIVWHAAIRKIVVIFVPTRTRSRFLALDLYTKMDILQVYYEICVMSPQQLLMKIYFMK